MQPINNLMDNLNNNVVYILGIIALFGPAFLIFTLYIMIKFKEYTSINISRTIIYSILIVVANSFLNKTQRLSINLYILMCAVLLFIIFGSIWLIKKMIHLQKKNP
ncbi:hypothetical protein DVR12_05545 [Chitinophaga silvatica]|uniref:Uncharacterized protein n=1 Tax=Chitinophaga silvatica TaxID=2282649 RepID=A0A3E1YEE8_9BACT|nr:hypothetical protein DVR12_05545 [Chitinophaga silvatica]